MVSVSFKDGQCLAVLKVSSVPSSSSFPTTRNFASSRHSEFVCSFTVTRPILLSCGHYQIPLPKRPLPISFTETVKSTKPVADNFGCRIGLRIMFSAIAPENQEPHVLYITVVGAGVGKREPVPQDSSCLTANGASNSDNSAVPFADLLSYGTNGSPTITMTKTLYSAGEVTSTTSDTPASMSASGKQEGTPNSLLSSMNVAPFMGVVLNTSATGSTQANSPSDGKSTTTGTSTVYNTITVTSTRISTTTVHDNSPLVSLISAHSNLTSSAASSTSAKIPLVTSVTSHVNATNNATNNAAPPKQQGGTIAGATLGSMAAFGMIGFLIWWCCAKKRGKRKLKIKFNMKRRKSSTAKTPQLEDQSMEETRRVMLERSKNLNDFLRSPPAQSNYSSAAELPGDVGLKRNVSQTESSRQHPSWIGVAVTSSTPPNTPPLPRSNSRKSTRTMQSTGNAPTGGYPNSLMPGFGSQHTPASLMPTPVKPAMKPAPIITSHNLARPEQVSPLSPRGMFNTVGNTASRTWRRASQVLSPGAYQRIADDGQSGIVTPKRRDSKPRIPELEIGHQTDKNWEGQWI